MAERGEMPAIAVRGLKAWYGESQVLHGLDLDIMPGEIVSILGRNGAGKTTALRSLMGLIPARTGSVRVNGAETIAAPSRIIVRMGVGYVPEERGIFSSLTVEENLLLPPVIGPDGLTVQEIYTLFPNLAERRRSRGTLLSGGEQQMLSIARVMRTGARIFLMDEPTEGLAPTLVDQIRKTVTKLKERRFTLLLVEQNFHFAVKVADRHIVLQEGLIVDTMSSGQVRSDLGRLKAYLGV
jgi:branched-chain amino acid transport system ATP-binding protein